MWTAKNRKRYDRTHLRYPSDLTDAEWELVAGLIPPAKRGVNRRRVDVRESVASCSRAQERSPRTALRRKV